MWQFCHFLFHPIGWFFWGSAGIGDNLGDGIITNFGDNLCDDFATICFTQYGDFFVDLPEMMRIKVIKLALYLVVWFPKWVGEPDYVFGDNPCDNLS